MLQCLNNGYGIQPYTIYQYQGEAVYIPAYCTHQVCHFHLALANILLGHRSQIARMLLKLLAISSPWITFSELMVLLWSSVGNV
jgi:hypothetical protein